MDWIEVTLYTSADGIEPVCGRLYQLGINGVSIEDEADFKDFLENNRACWDYVDEELEKSMHKETNVKFYLTNTAEGLETLALVRQSIEELSLLDKNSSFGRLETELSNLSEEDWANNWKQYFHTLNIGDRIIVKPEWENCDAADGKIVYSINPGMSFGTGSHHTTKMCIEELEKAVKPGCHMLDLGCGSGILSHISLLLGAADAFAVDIDPVAVEIAYQNAELNDIPEGKFTAEAGNVLDNDELRGKILSSKYDVVAANIVADVIIALAPLAYEATADDGTFITSGIIEDRMDDVKKALKAAGFEIVKTDRSADWAAFVCTKQG